jgi:hypothetical protein
VVHVLTVEAITGVKIAKRNQLLVTNVASEVTCKNFAKESLRTQRKKTEEITEDLKIVINTLQEAVASPCTRTQKLNIRKREW